MSFRSLLSFFILVCFFFNSSSAVLACGPSYANALFSYTRHADFPLKSYTSGKIGLVPPSYGRMSLFVFYRELSGNPLTEFEQKEVEIALRTRISGKSRESLSIANPEDNDPNEKWIEARKSLIEKPPPEIKEKHNPETYASHENCLPDAFRTALKTLDTRRAQYGVDEHLYNWINGQDAVFSNCGGKGLLPDFLSETAPEWLRKDRKYQIAAAYFYRDDFEAARSMFGEIAKDSSSPWSKTATFLLARLDTREADAIDLGGGWRPKKTSENQTNWEKRAEIYKRATSKLKQILNEPVMMDFHSSARRLLKRAAYHANPDERRNELAGILSSPKENKFIFHDLKDFISLLDDAEENAVEIGYAAESQGRKDKGDTEYYSQWDYKPSLEDYCEVTGQADLTDWLISFQIDTLESFNHAYQKWKKTGENTWLIAAVSKAGKSSPNLDEIMRAADSLEPDSPGFTTANYHIIRLLLEKGDGVSAKRKLAEVRFDELPISSRNRFLGLKAALASSLSEYLKAAKRKPVGVLWEYDENEAAEEFGDPESGYEDNTYKPLSQKLWFDEDAVAFFSEKAPVSILADAANSPETPPNLKKFLFSMAWARSLILKKGPLAQSLARQLIQYAPEYRPSLSKYVSANSAADREAAGLVAILRYPKIDANLPIGIGRESDSPITFDSNRGNWWCFEEEEKPKGELGRYRSKYGRYGFSYPIAYPAFLSHQQLSENEEERRILLASGHSATFLNKRAVEFARDHPYHLQLPEILHLAVRASRFGCTDDETVKYSREAFRILHRRFPKSEWTAKTPYYFG